MPEAHVTIRIETGADFAALLNTTPLSFGADGRARVPVEMGTENLLLWSVSGNPGAKYKITLSAPGSRKIEMVRGRNPEASRISTRKFRGGGSFRFAVVPGDGR